MFKKYCCIIGVILFAAGCSKPLHKDSEFYMGTFVEVISSDPKASQIVFAEFKRLESIFNLFNENSELSRLNDTGSVVASPDLLRIIKKSKEVYKATDGAFDVTIAPLSLLWKSAIDNQEPPPDEDIKDLLDVIGCDNVYIDEKTATIKILKSGCRIDLGGIAKGYAVDSAVAKLKAAHITSAVVNAGGNLYCLGDNRGVSWKTGVQDPRQEKHVIAQLDLKNEGVATSGDYEQFFIYQNKRFSHIINPKTGYPADSGIISATIVSPDATTADALATAVVVSGLEKGKKILERYPDARALLVDKNGVVHRVK